MRISQCENDIHEIRIDQRAMLDLMTKIKDRLNIWGTALLAGLIGSGIISGEAGTILKGAFGVG